MLVSAYSTSCLVFHLKNTRLQPLYITMHLRSYTYTIFSTFQ